MIVLTWAEQWVKENICCSILNGYKGKVAFLQAREKDEAVIKTQDDFSCVDGWEKFYLRDMQKESVRFRPCLDMRGQVKMMTLLQA